MPQSGANQHEGRVSVWKGANDTGASADFPVKPFNDIVGADACPVFKRKVGIGKGFFPAGFHFFCCLVQLHLSEGLYNSFGFLTGCCFVLLGMDCF